MQPPMMTPVDGRPAAQLGQICYVPLYIMPHAGAPPTASTLQSCAAALAAGPTSAGSSFPVLVQFPPSAAPVSPGASSPASPGQVGSTYYHQQPLPQQAQTSAPKQPPVIPEFRLANFASLLPPSSTTSSVAQQQHQQLQQQQQYQHQSPFAQLAQPAGFPFPSHNAGAAGTSHYPAFAFPAGYSPGRPMTALEALLPADLHQAAAAAAAMSTTTTAQAAAAAAAAGDGRKEIKFKYHMSLMPQLAVASTPAPPKVEMKKKRKPRMRITGRVCTHCGATKTTEWRMGPEGRGTLCNACGLRYRKKLLSDGQKDPNAKISMSMLLNATKKSSKTVSSSTPIKEENVSPLRRSGEESP